MVIAADDVGDFHVVVVHDHRQHVGGRAVGAQQHHVVKLLVGDPDFALDLVGDHGLTLVRRFEPDHGRDPGRGLRGIAVAPASVIAHRPSRGTRRLAHLGELFRRAEAVIGLALGEQVPRYLGVALGVARLVDHVTVPVEAKPFETVDDRRDCLGRRPPPIGVLQTQQEPAAVMAGKEPVEQRGAGATDMEEAGGRGGKAGDDGHGFWVAGTPLVWSGLGV